MYFNPCRRRGQGVAGDSARQRSADSHTGGLRDFLRRHCREAAEAARTGGRTRTALLARLLERAADPRNLRLAWDWCAQGGQSPGTDGLHFDDLEGHEVWDLVRLVSRAIRDNTYRPAPDREKIIPKSSGRGHRTLRIPAVIDRTVQRAVVQIVQPHLDPFLDDHSLAYRPGSDTLRALALAEDLTIEHDLWVWLLEDLRNAFDNIPQRRLLDVLRLHLPNEGIMRLIEQLVVTETGRGVRQGGNLSPLLLNVYLHHLLDRKWRRLHPHAPCLRWADDLLVLSHSQADAGKHHQDLRKLLEPGGMTLKGMQGQSTRDLTNGTSADWLGYRVLRGENGLMVQLTEEAWQSLAENLEAAQGETDSPLRAQAIITGWISQMGPCYQQTDMQQAYARIIDLARRQAFDEIPSEEEICRLWEKAHKRWEKARSSCREGRGR